MYIVRIPVTLILWVHVLSFQERLTAECFGVCYQIASRIGKVLPLLVMFLAFHTLQ